MKFVIDAHLHLYPCYDLNLAVRTLARNLEAGAPGAVACAFLTERQDCDYFTRFSAEGLTDSGHGIAVLPANSGRILTVTEKGERRAYIFPGRQYATRERIEILALGVRPEIQETASARETVEKILEADGIPVLSWAPGKWMFGRSAVVKELVERFCPGDLLIGDSALRPRGVPEPRLIKEARAEGTPVVAGSDPLPISGEEKRMGGYVTVAEGGHDPEKPADSVRDLLRQRPLNLSAAGRRCSALGTALRLLRLRLS
ncbi:MAG: hypothetical protein R6V03_06135 [Kiritimatiellia bacterium]